MQFFKSFIYFYVFIILQLLTQSAFAQNRPYLQQLETEMMDLVNQVSPSIVTISAKFDYAIIDKSKGSLFTFKDKVKRPVEITNIGSGFIVDSTYIITKSTVVNGSQDITVVFYDSTIHQGKVVGSDPELGLSIIKVDTVMQNHLALDTHNQMNPGCWVLVMGNSMGIAPSVSFGIVNCIRKDDIFQVSTNVAAGNAGGAIFSTSGKMVGIMTNSSEIDANSAILGSTFFNNEMVYAWSGTKISRSLAKILDRSQYPTGWIGVTAEDWPGQTGGVHLSSITPGGPADKADLRIGDIILTIDNKKMDNTMELANCIKFKHPGEKVTLQFLRGNGLQSKTIMVGNQKDDTRSSYYTNVPEASAPVISPFMEEEESLSDQDNRFLLKQRIDYLEQEIHSLKNMIDKR